MIETTQTVLIDRPIADVWDFACDIRGWAELMPGLQDCEVVDADNSRWTLKVGAGGMVRKVTVLVHVDEWRGPGQVLFSYTLDKDPVEGGGTYTARAVGPEQTEVDLHVRVVGSGAMAPMWEAMGKPLLPKLAAGFADQFKARIEASGATGDEAVTPTAPRARRGSLLSRIAAFIRSLFASPRR